MDLQLEGKRALVTGATNGIGVGIVRALAAEGARVAVHGRDRDRTERVAKGITENGGEAHSAIGDLGTDAGAAQAYGDAVAGLGGVDILVNNMGVYLPSDWPTTTADRWAVMMNANVVSAVRMISHVVPEMRERGWGRIINNGSGEAQQPLARMPEYAASKAAMMNMTASLARELAGSGVTANTVSPGIIATDSLQAFFAEVARERGWGDAWPTIEKRVAAEWAPNTVGRLGTVDEVAAFFAYVASPLSGFINGSNLRIDGGFVSAVL